MKRFFSLFSLVLLVVFSSTLAQVQNTSADDYTFLESLRGRTFNQQVSTVWLNVCAMNRVQYPDSNRIMPGNKIKLPLGKFYVAKPGRNDHMWMASVFFVNEEVIPYLQNSKTIPAKEEDVLWEQSWLYKIFFYTVWVVCILSFFALLYLIFLFFTRRMNKKEKAAKEAVEKVAEETANPFISSVPDFDAPDSEVLPVAQSSFQAVYGKGFQIISEIQRVRIFGGPLKVLHSNGEWTSETFPENNGINPGVQGFRALIRFDNGNEKWLVSKWGCFNPMWGTLDGDFSGEFISEDDELEEFDIPQISKQELRETSANVLKITKGENPDLSRISCVTLEPKETQEIKEVKSEGSIKLTEITVGKTTIKGEIELVSENVEIITKIMKTAADSYKEK